MLAVLDQRATRLGLGDVRGHGRGAPGERHVQADDGALADATAEDFLVGEGRWQKPAGAMVVDVISQAAEDNVGWCVDEPFGGVGGLHVRRDSLYQTVRVPHGTLGAVLRQAPPRERLLAAAVDYVLANGFSNLSLRELAAAIGTSHRMLIYHFGSKEGMLVAIVRGVEAAQREFFDDLLRTQPDLPPGEGIRLMWRHFTDPQLAPHERLFFDIYAQALQGRPGTNGLLDDVVEAWIDPVAAYAIQRGVPAEAARADARLGVAVIRGLLLDLLATGNRPAVDAALERYIAQYEALHAGRGYEPVTRPIPN
jgi:AcrR family transcriptional regulator